MLDDSSATDSIQECDLCEEIRLAGTVLTGGRRYGEDSYSRLIRRTSVVDVMAGVGSLIPGYVLVIPRRHTRSMGELTQLELRHVFDDAWIISDRIRRIFGCSVVLVEHGSSGSQAGPSGVCIEHAHMHLFPLDSGIDPSCFRLAVSKPLNDLADLRRLASSRRNYYFCSWSRPESYLCEDPKLVSQYARRIWATAVGRPDEWDWGAFPFMANARLTATRLRRDELPFEEAGPSLGDAELAETLAAYDAAAGWYASRTRAFPANSTLPAEIKSLADTTEGLIMDAGAGGGRDAHSFADLGRSVIALDASQELLREMAPSPNIWRVAGDIRFMPFTDRSFGAVWCSAVLLHFGREDVLRSLHELHRVLDVGGSTQISVKEGTGHSASGFRDDLSFRRHFFYYEAEDLIQFAKLAGFEVKDIWTEDEIDASATLQRWVKVLLKRSSI